MMKWLDFFKPDVQYQTCLSIVMARNGRTMFNVFDKPDDK